MNVHMHTINQVSKFKYTSTDLYYLTTFLSHPPHLQERGCPPEQCVSRLSMPQQTATCSGATSHPTATLRPPLHSLSNVADSSQGNQVFLHLECQFRFDIFTPDLSVKVCFVGLSQVAPQSSGRTTQCHLVDKRVCCRVTHCCPLLAKRGDRMRPSHFRPAVCSTSGIAHVLLDVSRICKLI